MVTDCLLALRGYIKFFLIDRVLYYTVATDKVFKNDWEIIILSSLSQFDVLHQNRVVRFIGAPDRASLLFREELTDYVYF